MFRCAPCSANNAAGCSSTHCMTCPLQPHSKPTLRCRSPTFLPAVEVEGFVTVLWARKDSPTPLSMPSSHLSSITPEVLSSLFVCSEKEASKILGICLTTLKKACRRHGIDRWPYRKIKSGQLLESHNLKRSSSNSARNPPRNSVSPAMRSSDYDSESSSQISSNTTKLAHSSFASEEQSSAEETIFSSLVNPPSVYSYDDGDAWMNAIEENSWKIVDQQQQQQLQQCQLEPQRRHQTLMLVSGHIVSPPCHFELRGSDVEYSDIPVLYSRPIETSYNC
jgi:hypothetical protein